MEEILQQHTLDILVHDCAETRFASGLSESEI